MKKFLICIDANDIQSDQGVCIRHHRETYRIVCDGELYNLHQLFLQLSVEFSLKETMEEIIFYAWYKWGNAVYQHLEGAYSYAIIDNESCLVVKDPLGLRPIFYCEYNQRIYISNSIKTLLEESKKPAILNREGILNLFSFGPSLPEDKTLFAGIYALPMGSYLLVDEQVMHTTAYYSIPVKEHTDDFITTTNTIRQLLEYSIQTQADQCKANFLSGGLDSSIITAVCAKNNSGWKTHSLEYEGNKENFKGNTYQVSLDTSYIEQMIERFSCHHHVHTIKQEILADLLEDAMLARDHPGMADVDSSLLWLCQQVASQEMIILSGECSDEIFGGYPWFYREELKELDTFPWLQSMGARISLLHKDIQNFPYEDHIQSYYKQSISQVTYLESDTNEDRRARMQTHLCLHWFMQTLVTRQVSEGDYANVNIRAPFANVKLLEYVYNIPWKMKFYQDQEKGILRKAFEQDLPHDICWRKKNPFPKTHNPIYTDIVAEKLMERYQDPDSPLHVLFDDEKLNDLIQSKGASYTLPWYGQLMSGPQLLAYLYQIDCWILDYHIQIEY